MNLVECLPEVQWRILPREQRAILQEAADCDIVHFNYTSSIHPSLTADGVRQLHAMGKKTVLTYHEGHPNDNKNSLTTTCTRTVLTYAETNADIAFDYVPMPIPAGGVAAGEAERLVGTIGIPFCWKGIDQIALIAKNLNLGFLGICPTYDLLTNDTRQGQQRILESNPDAILFKDWMSKEEAMEQLGRCAVLVFAHNTASFARGVSSACRYGLATGRPVVMNKMVMYQDLFSYADEIHFTNSSGGYDGVAEQITEAIKPFSKRPKRLLTDMGWPHAAQIYKKIYEEITQ